MNALQKDTVIFSLFLVTRCTMYRQYATDEALQKAAESYGGLTGDYYLFP
jgi:hypothetical protein